MIKPTALPAQDNSVQFADLVSQGASSNICNTPLGGGNGRQRWITACWDDMRRRQAVGQAFVAEDYIFESLLDSDLIVDLVYGEYELKRAVGQSVVIDDLMQRFPDQADALKRQFEFAEAISSYELSRAEIGGVEAPPAQTSSAPPLPERIGRYLILEALCEGGQARVYRALHPDLKIEVAIKFPLHNSVDAVTQHHLLVAEARTLAAMSHPNLGRVVDLNFVDDCPYLVSEYIAGRTLEQFLLDQPVTPHESAALISKVARGMAVAHRVGVVHLDIKPRNILIDDRGEPRLIDFGLAIKRNTPVDSAEKSRDFVEHCSICRRNRPKRTMLLWARDLTSLLLVVCCILR